MFDRVPFKIHLDVMYSAVITSKGYRNIIFNDWTCQIKFEF